VAPAAAEESPAKAEGDAPAAAVEEQKAASPPKEEEKVVEEEQLSPSKKAEAEEAARRANQKGDNEFYPDGYVSKELPDTQISKRNFAFHTVLGMPSMKRYNIHFLTPTTIIFVAGNKYQTYNLQT
jgi:hypothetical protein